MNLWYAKAAFLALFGGIVAIRAPHGNRSGKVRVVESRKGFVETALLTLAMASSLFPLIWVCGGLFSFADYALRPAPYAAGVILMAFGLWLFYRSHADLGTNWSITLQVRENHRLITSGVYSRIRHPMYSSLFVLGIAQMLFLPNWIVGPSYFVGFGVLYLFRIKAEERMMLDRFGAEYENYARRSGRLIPR
jgi:protein-S-isoprenylcysteine O-methyltransferase Ste14